MLHEEDKERSSLLPYLVSSVWPEGAEVGSDKMIKVIQSLNQRYQELAQDLSLDQDSQGDLTRLNKCLNQTQQMELQIKEEGLSDYTKWQNGTEGSIQIENNNSEGSLERQNKRTRWDDPRGEEQLDVYSNYKKALSNTLHGREKVENLQTNHERFLKRKKIGEVYVERGNVGKEHDNGKKSLKPRSEQADFPISGNNMPRPVVPDIPPAYFKECIGIVINLVNDNYGLAAVTLPGHEGLGTRGPHHEGLGTRGPHLVLFDTCEFWVGDTVVADADIPLSEVVGVGDLVKVNAVKMEKVNKRNVKYLATAVTTNGDLAELILKTFDHKVKLIKDIANIPTDKLTNFQIVVEFLARQTITLEEKEAVIKSAQLAVKIFNLMNIPAAVIPSSSPILHPSTIPPFSQATPLVSGCPTYVNPNVPPPPPPNSGITPSYLPASSTTSNPVIPASTISVNPYLRSPITTLTTVNQYLFKPNTSSPPHLSATSRTATCTHLSAVNPHLPVSSTSVIPRYFLSATNPVNPQHLATNNTVPPHLPATSTNVPPVSTARVKATNLPGKMTYWNGNLISNIDTDEEYIDCVYCMETLALKEDDEFAPYYLEHYASQNHLFRVSAILVDQEAIDKYLCGTCMLGLRMKKEEETGTAVAFHKFSGRKSFYQCRYGKCDAEMVVSAWHFYHLKDDFKHKIHCSVCNCDCKSAVDYHSHTLTNAHQSIAHAKKMRMENENKMEKDERALEKERPSLLDVKLLPIPLPSHILKTKQNNKEEGLSDYNKWQNGTERSMAMQMENNNSEGSLQRQNKRVKWDDHQVEEHLDVYSNYKKAVLKNTTGTLIESKICRHFNGPKGCPREPKGLTCEITDITDNGSSKNRTLFHQCSFKATQQDPHCGKFHSKHYHNNEEKRLQLAVGSIQDNKKTAVSCDKEVSGQTDLIDEMEVCRQFNGPKEPKGSTCEITDDDNGSSKTLFHQSSFKSSQQDGKLHTIHTIAHAKEMRVENKNKRGTDHPKGNHDERNLEKECPSLLDTKLPPLPPPFNIRVNNTSQNTVTENNKRTSCDVCTTSFSSEFLSNKEWIKLGKECPSCGKAQKFSASIDGMEICGQFNGPNGCPRDPNGKTCVLADGSNKTLIHLCSYKSSPLDSYCGKFHSKYSNHKTVLEGKKAAPIKKSTATLIESKICCHFNGPKGCPREAKGSACEIKNADNGSSKIYFHICSFKSSQQDPHCGKFHSKYFHETEEKRLQLAVSSQDTNKTALIDESKGSAVSCDKDVGGQAALIDGMEVCGQFNGPSEAKVSKITNADNGSSKQGNVQNEVKADPTAFGQSLKMKLCIQFNGSHGCPREPNGQKCFVKSGNKLLHRCSYKNSRGTYCWKFHSKHNHHTVGKVDTVEEVLIDKMEICGQFNSPKGCPRAPNGQECCPKKKEKGMTNTFRTLIHRCSYKDPNLGTYCGKFHSKHYHNIVDEETAASCCQDNKKTALVDGTKRSAVNCGKEDGGQAAFIDKMELCGQFNVPKGCPSEPKESTCEINDADNSSFKHVQNEVKAEPKALKQSLKMELCRQFNTPNGCLREPNGQECVQKYGNKLLHRCSYKNSCGTYCWKFHSKHNHKTVDKETSVSCGKEVRGPYESQVLMDGMEVCADFNGPNGCTRDINGQKCIFILRKEGTSKTLLHCCSFKSSQQDPHCGKFHSKHYHETEEKRMQLTVSCGQDNKKAALNEGSAVSCGEEDKYQAALDRLEVCGQFIGHNGSFQHVLAQNEVKAEPKASGQSLKMELCIQFNEKNYCPRKPNGQECVQKNGNKLLHRCSYKNRRGTYCWKFHSKHYHETVEEGTSDQVNEKSSLIDQHNGPSDSCGKEVKVQAARIDGMEVCVQFNSPKGCPRDPNGEKCFTKWTNDSSSRTLVHRCSYKDPNLGTSCGKFHSKHYHENVVEGTTTVSGGQAQKKERGMRDKDVKVLNTTVGAFIDGMEVCGQFNGPKGCPRAPKMAKECFPKKEGTSKTLVHRCSYKSSPLGSYCGKFHSKHSTHETKPKRSRRSKLCSN